MGMDGDNHFYDVDPVTGLYVNQSGDGSPLDSEQWSDMDGDGYQTNDQSEYNMTTAYVLTAYRPENDRLDVLTMMEMDGLTKTMTIPSNNHGPSDGDGYGDNPAGILGRLPHYTWHSTLMAIWVALILMEMVGQAEMPFQ